MNILSFFLSCLFLFLLSQTITGNQFAFDLNEAETQLMFSYAAYCPENNVTNWQCYFCTRNKGQTGEFVLTRTISDPVFGTFGYVGHNGQTVEIVFRGTRGVQNVIEDIDDIQISPAFSFPLGVWVHSGFYTTFLAVRDQVRSAVEEVVQLIKPTRLIFSGHSLGGALTAFAAVDNAPKYPSIPTTLYTFGQPRLGNDAFASYVESVVPTIWRIVNKDDLVPHLPFSLLLVNYRHYTQEVWWTSTNTSYKICNSNNGEDSQCSDSVRIDNWNVNDHLDYLGILLDQGGC